MTKKLTLLVVLLATSLVLSACGDDENPEDQVHTATNGNAFNDADVAFATDLIQHHAQAIQMTALTLERDLDPEVERLAEDIPMAQSPEVETMVTWLTDWDLPIPETVLDHANAHGDGHVDRDLPGMMSKEQMDELEAAQGTEFQRLFLEMMIEHHQGAIEMAQAEQSEGHFGPALRLAKRIEKAQQQEITTMEALLQP